MSRIGTKVRLSKDLLSVIVESIVDTVLSLDKSLLDFAAREIVK